MFIGIVVALIAVFTVISFLGGALKKTMEIVSTLLRLGVGGIVSMLVCRAIGVDFSNQGRLFLYVLIGALIVFALISVLASMFRLVGYSINFFINSMFIGILVTILENKISIGFGLYAVILFLLPRIFWISDRLATTQDYSHSEYDPIWNVRTYFYSVSPMDWWEDSEDSWKWIPFQIIIASLFYLVGCCTLFSFYSLPAQWLEIVVAIVAIALNILFDLFVFRKIEEHHFG